MMKIEIYKLDVANADLVRIDEITTWKSLSYFHKLNGIGGCIFTLSVYDRKATKENLTRFRNQIVIKDGNSVEWFGTIAKVYGGINNQGFEDITIECYSYLSHFTSRYTNKLQSYVQEDQMDIAWDLINTTQTNTNGTLLVSRGSYSATVDRDRTYEYSEVAQSIINMANVIDGFDFTFDASLDSNNLMDGVVFNCYVALGNKRTDLVPFSISNKNLKSFTFVTKTDLSNTVTAEGAGTGSPLIKTSSDSSLQIGYTRREKILTEKDISVPETLQEKADTYKRMQSVESWDFELEVFADTNPTYGSYSLGDLVKIDLSLIGSGDYLQFSEWGRIIELGVSVDQQGVKTIAPKFSI